MNFSRDVVDAAPASARALVALARDGSRCEWSFGEVAGASARAAGALAARGVGRGDVVMTLVGNRPEWVLTMLACFRIGAVVLPCTEQLRAADLRARLDVAQPRLIVCDERNAGVLGEAAPDADVLLVPGPELTAAEPHPAVELEPEDPCLVTFTSGTAGEPKAVLHGQRYLTGQRVQAEHWLAPRPGRAVVVHRGVGLVEVGPQRLHRAVAARRGGAAARRALRPAGAARDPRARARRHALHGADGVPRDRQAGDAARRSSDLHGLVAAGEALNPEVLRAWHEATGLWIRDGYGQTETGQLTGMPLGEEARPGSMGRALPGIALDVADGELVADPATVPTFFVRYLGGEAAPAGPWRTGDRVRRDDDGFLYFEGRLDDVIISAGYRIGPFEVESALVAHAAVAEAAVVAAPDEERGSVVRAVVVLRDGHAPSDDLARELQEHVKARTAPYKYPRVVDFADDLPKTASGKVRRAVLRDG